MEVEWFLSDGEHTEGPGTLSELTSLLREQSDPLKFLIWRPGLEDWMPVADVPELAEFRRPPPLPEILPSQYQTAAAINKKLYRPAKRSSRVSLILTLLIIGPVMAFIGSEFNKQGEIANPACVSDYRKCTDNADLMNNYDGVVGAEVRCKSEAQNDAKFGSPEFPWWFAFTHFHTGNDYVKTGIAALIEPDAQFQNEFSAMVHSTVVCTYDLNQKKVIDLSITPN
jgi:hypothetical protein